MLGVEREREAEADILKARDAEMEAAMGAERERHATMVQGWEEEMVTMREGWQHSEQERERVKSFVIEFQAG